MLGLKKKKKNLALMPQSLCIFYLKLSFWTSTTLGIVSGTTSWVCLEELIRLTLSNTEQWA